MSRSSTSSQSSAEPFDEAAEARELEEFFRQQNPIDVVAAQWHTRWEQGLTASEQADLEQWLGANPTHAAAFERLDGGVAAAKRVPAERLASARENTARRNVEPDPVGVHRFRASNSKSQHSRKHGSDSWSLGNLLPRPALVAFCLIAFMAAGIGWHWWLQQPTFTASYIAERGQRKEIQLPDGSGLAFDAETQAQVTLYRDRREVSIDHGQIMFTVAPNPEQPFHVMAGKARVTVVGTRFSVRYRNDGATAGAVKVAVEEGHVRVVGTTQNNSSTLPMDLIVGQGITVSATGELEKIVAALPGSIAPWRKGLIRFEDTPLSEALLELERYGPTGLVLRDPAVAAMTIGGTYHIGRPGEFAKMVAQILPVRLSQTAAGSTEIVKAR